MEQIQGLLVQLGILIGLVWAGSELIGAVVKLPKDLVALILGVLSALVAEGVGWIDVAPGPWGFAGAFLLGLLATAAAAVGHDKLAKPAYRALRGKG